MSGRLHQPYYRNGPSHRDGADVTFSDIRKIFGFSSIQIGRWVTPQEQQIAANLFFDGFYDLADILQVNETVISLRGTLSLGFGVGGDKYSSAHYNAQRHRLALAKNAGGGALAHEWFHAFDHYVCKPMFGETGPNSFASHTWLHSETQLDHPLNELLGDVFHSMFLTADGNNIHKYVERSVFADRKLQLQYYSQPQEMAARAFEGVIQASEIKNAFLVAGTMQSQEAKLGLYPDAEHRTAIAEQLLTYFFQLGKAIAATDS